MNDLRKCVTLKVCAFDGWALVFLRRDRRRIAILEKDSSLGAYNIVFPGVTVGEGAVVVAISIVNKDIPPWSIAVGVPAKVI